MPQELDEPAAKAGANRRGGGLWIDSGRSERFRRLAGTLNQFTVTRGLLPTSNTRKSNASGKSARPSSSVNSFGP
jgi:hypothetical protein